MAATNLYMNWSSVTITPAGGSATTLTEVTDVEVEKGGDVKRWSADGGLFAKAIVQKNKTRKLKIMGGAVNKLAVIPEDTSCTVVAVLNDLYNGSGTGALTVTATHAILINNPFKGKHNEFATGDVEFECYSADGTTDPVTIVQGV